MTRLKALLRRNAWAIFGRLLFPFGLVGVFLMGSAGSPPAGFILITFVGLACVAIGELVDIRRAVTRTVHVNTFTWPATGTR